MTKINRMRIRGFRRLEDVDLRVKPFLVAIGANGVGKSSLLDAFSLLSASASGKLSESVSRLGGITSLLTRGRAEELSLLAHMDVPGHLNLEYEVRLVPRSGGYAIAAEVLSQLREGYAQPFKYIDSKEGGIKYYDVAAKRLVQPEWEPDPLETSLSQVPKLSREPEKLRRTLATATRCHALEVGPRAPVKLPQPMRPAVLPGSSGEDLVPYLYYLRETEEHRFSAIVDSLRAAFPGFESLGFPPVAAGMLSMTWKERGFARPINIHELSEGTLRFLWLVSLLQSPALSTVTMIDEPEVSLHPELLSLLADLMREASKRTQLIVATHSDRFIRFLRPEEVVVMDIAETGGSTATWADTMDLDEWLADYSLDEVWRLGRMGGRS